MGVIVTILFTVLGIRFGVHVAEKVIEDHGETGLPLKNVLGKDYIITEVKDGKE